MIKFIKFLSYLLISFSLTCLAFSVITVIDGDTPGATYAGLFMTFTFGIPGTLLFIHFKKKEKFDTQFRIIEGIISTRDRFKISELADAMKITPDMAERYLLQYLGSNNSIDILYHEATLSYLKRSALGDNTEIKEQCQSCGSKLTKTVLLSGESVKCRYCGGKI